MQCQILFPGEKNKKKTSPICRLLNKPRGWYVRICDLDIPREYLKQIQAERGSRAFQYPG